ncbi:copper-binding protein [Pelomonas aquatica]|jgi:Cu(I)/Ag(I) efflux system protein CusF|uniref:Copper-binding protein n=1 Tax=Pelomonas aquatica TaxID=431058 RepID=A0A9X4LE79_9BURK|nr:copper-binding protein [Pelomonas aquatica]MCY4755041.1 copper-binding protein [Pelomonas aquatica]MDG0860942.1 copper-binding protein [Pelomonas aquatica]
MNKLTQMLAAAALALAAHAQAQTAPVANATATAAAPQSEGEVRKIDRAQGKLTLRHGPLDNLGMPAMTMVFKVADPKLLDGLKEGDKVRFTVERLNGAFTVTAIEASQG